MRVRNDAIDKEEDMKEQELIVDDAEANLMLCAEGVVMSIIKAAKMLGVDKFLPSTKFDAISAEDGTAAEEDDVDDNEDDVDEEEELTSSDDDSDEEVSERSERKYKAAQARLVPKSSSRAAFVVKLTISHNLTRFACRILSWHSPDRPKSRK